MKLYEILVPTMYGDEKKPISTKHHKNWDAFVRKISGGLTILKPAKGQWINKGELLEERVIPVRVMCEAKDIVKIVSFTLSHYRQLAVMYYVISNECHIVQDFETQNLVTFGKDYSKPFSVAKGHYKKDVPKL